MREFSYILTRSDGRQAGGVVMSSTIWDALHIVHELRHDAKDIKEITIRKSK